MEVEASSERPGQTTQPTRVLRVRVFFFFRRTAMVFDKQISDRLDLDWCMLGYASCRATRQVVSKTAVVTVSVGVDWRRAAVAIPMQMERSCARRRVSAFGKAAAGCHRTNLTQVARGFLFGGDQGREETGDDGWQG